MELEDKMLSSADNMTAAQIAADTKKDSHCIESWQYTITCAVLKTFLFTALYW
jgi:hypothetical protein